MEAINLAVENLVQMRLKSVLKTIAADFELDLKILKERYLQVEVEEEVEESAAEYVVEKKTQKKKTQKKKTETKEVSREGKCTCTTAKGLLCRNRALAGSEMCGIHARTLKAKSDDETEAKKKPAPKNKKKKEIVHTHALGEEVEEGKCDLCESHGNPVTPVMTGRRLEFEPDEDAAKIAAEFEAAMAVSEGEESESEAEGSEYVPSEGAVAGEEEFM
jgi:hypothetical protein